MITNTADTNKKLEINLGKSLSLSKSGTKHIKKTIPDTNDTNPSQIRSEKIFSKKDQQISDFMSVFNVQINKNASKNSKLISSQGKKNFPRIFDEDKEKDAQLLLPKIPSKEGQRDNSTNAKKENDKVDYPHKLYCDAKQGKFEIKKSFETPTKIHGHRIDQDKTNTIAENNQNFIRIDSSSKSPFKIKNSNISHDSSESKTVKYNTPNNSTSISSHDDKGKSKGNKMKIFYELECASKIIQRKVRQFLSRKKLELLRSGISKSPDTLGNITFGFNTKTSQEQVTEELQIKSRIENRNNRNRTAFLGGSCLASNNSEISNKRLHIQESNSPRRSLNSSLRSEVSVMSIDTNSIDHSSDDELSL